MSLPAVARKRWRCVENELDSRPRVSPFQNWARSAKKQTTMIPTQHTLVARLQQSAGDADWSRFYELYCNAILAFAASWSLNEADCRDVLQETMVKLCRRLPTFERDGRPFTPWLLRITRHCVIDALRRRDRWRKRHDSLDEAPLEGSTPLQDRLRHPGPDPMEAATHQAQLALVEQILDFFVQRKCFQQRTVDLFKAVTFEQRDPQEVAATFGTSRGNVDQAKSAVLARTRRVLAGLDEGLDLEESLAR